jgi:hypothetical protein
MKNTCILAVFAMLTSVSLAQNGSQTKRISTQSNGVVVHESAGNEGFVTVDTQPKSDVRTIEHWTLPECIDGLHVIAEKVAGLGTSGADLQQRAEYLTLQQRIEQRKQELIAKSY